MSADVAMVCPGMMMRLESKSISGSTDTMVYHTIFNSQPPRLWSQQHVISLSSLACWSEKPTAAPPPAAQPAKISRSGGPAAVAGSVSHHPPPAAAGGAVHDPPPTAGSDIHRSSLTAPELGDITGMAGMAGIADI